MTANVQPAEEDLIRRFQGGDEEAFRILFERCEEVLRARAAHWMNKALQRRVSIADVLQESRIAAFECREDLEDRGNGSFRNWLLGIVDAKARRAVQWHAATAKRAIAREITRQNLSAIAGYHAREPSPSQAAIGTELVDLARRAMALLPSDYREVLRLAREEHLNLREIAGRLGRTREAVKKLYGRALVEFTERFDRLRGENHG